MKFYCIGDEETARGFRLAGVVSYAVGSAAEAARALEIASGKADCGIIIMPRATADLVRARVDKIKLEGEWPLIAEVAGPPTRRGG